MAITKDEMMEILLRILVKEGENLLFGVYRSALGVLIKGGLQVALGPIGVGLTYAELVAFASKVGIGFAKEIKKTSQSGTSYDVHTTKSGVLIAENTKPSTLRDIYFPLPEYFEVPIEKLYNQETAYLEPTNYFASSFSRINSTEVFKTLSENYYQVFLPCQICGNQIFKFGSSVVGHAVLCLFNPNREKEWCSECETDITKNLHKFKCSKNPMTKACPDCLGSGKYTYRGMGGSYWTIDCDKCDGTGKVWAILSLGI